MYTHILQPHPTMGWGMGYYDDKRTYCGLNRHKNTYGYTFGTISETNKRDQYCHFCHNGYLFDKEGTMTAQIHPRANDSGVTSKDIADLNDISGQQVWDTLSSFGIAELPFMVKTKIFNRLINRVEYDAATVTVTPRDLYNNLDTYKGRQVQYSSAKPGVLTDVAWVGANNVYHMVIDGAIWGAPADAPIRVRPDLPESDASRPSRVALKSAYDLVAADRRRDEEISSNLQQCQSAFHRKFKPSIQCAKPALHIGLCAFEREDGVLCFIEDDVRLVPFSQDLRGEKKITNESPSIGNSTVRINADNLYRNKANWVGKLLMVEGYPTQGIFTDAMQNDSGTISMVIDGKLFTVAAFEYVNLKESPFSVKPKIYAKYSADWVFKMRRSFYGKSIRHDGDVDDIGIFTAATDQGKGKSLIFVVDGNIIHFTPDAELWVEL